MNTRLAASAVALAVLVLLAPADAAACSCVQVSPAMALAEHDAVFEGRVVAVEAEGDPHAGRLRVTMAVVQHWKGVDRETVEVTTAAQTSMCGIPFAPDTSWLVYADREGGELSTGLCSRTRPILEAEEDLAVLGAGVVPVEIDESDEVEPPAPAEPPARGGCASCTVGGDRPLPPLGGLLIAALFAWRRRRPADHDR